MYGRYYSLHDAQFFCSKPVLKASRIFYFYAITGCKQNTLLLKFKEIIGLIMYLAICNKTIKVSWEYKLYKFTGDEIYASVGGRSNILIDKETLKQHIITLLKHK